MTLDSPSYVEARPVRPRTMMSIGAERILVEAGVGLAAAAFLLSVFLCGLTRTYAVRFGFLDRPGGHKGHKAPVPLGGGVAIWLTTMTVLGLSGLAVVLGRSRFPRRWQGMSQVPSIARGAHRDPGPGHS